MTNHPISYGATSPDDHRRVPMPNRAEVRRLATQHHAELARTAAAHGNPHQAALDQQDKVTAYANALGPEDGLLFMTMYTEELQAITDHAVAELRAPTTTSDEASSTQLLGGLLAVAVVIAVLWFLLS